MTSAARLTLAVSAFTAVVMMADDSSTVESASETALQPLLTAAARGTAWTLNHIGYAARCSDNVIADTGGFALRIDVGCLSLPLIGLLVLCFIQYPAPRRHKIVGAVLGTGAFGALQLVRYTHLFHAGVEMPRSFAWHHDVIWRLIQSVALLVVWFTWRAWAERSAVRDEW